jgi:hypothetical protein
MKCLLTCLLLSILSAPLLADSTRITVIDLQGRPAQELIPLIEPMLDTGDAVTGTGYQLILRTRAENLPRIQALIERLDQAPRRLRITVHRGELDARERQRQEAYLERDTSRVRIEAGEAPAAGGLQVERRDASGNAGVRIESTRRLRDSSQRQQVQALEGQPAHIATGIAFPHVNRVERYGPYDSVTGIEYREATTGFYVLARLRGDGQVQLDISPHKENLSPRGGGMVDTSTLVTRVAGPVNTWLELGGTGESRQDREQDYARTRSTRDHQEEQVWFRVELLD